MAVHYDLLRLTPGVPVAFDVQFADAVRNDKKGPQIRLRGTVDGARMQFFGLHDIVFNELLAADALGQVEPYNEHDLPAKGGIELRLVRRHLELLYDEADPARPLKIRVRGAEPAPAPTAPPAAPDPAAPEPLPSPAEAAARRVQHRSERAHEEALRFVLATLVPIYRAHGIEPTSTDVTSLTNTHFIDRRRTG